MKKYKLIYAGPPWAYRVWSKKGADRPAGMCGAMMWLTASNGYEKSGLKARFSLTA